MARNDWGNHNFPKHHHATTKFEMLTPNLKMSTLISNNLHTCFFPWWSRTHQKKEQMTTWFLVMRYRQIRYWEEPCRIFSTNPRNDVLANLWTAVEFGFFFGWREVNTARACCLKVPHDELLRTWKKTTSLHMFKRKLPKKIMEITHLFSEKYHEHAWILREQYQNLCHSSGAKFCNYLRDGDQSKPQTDLDCPQQKYLVSIANVYEYLSVICTLYIYIYYMLLKWMQSDTVLQKTFDDINWHKT